MASRNSSMGLDIPDGGYDPSPVMDGFQSLVSLGGQMSAQAPKAAPRVASPEQKSTADFLDSSERMVNRLRARQQMFQIQNEIAAATKLQESKEADFALEPIVAELSAYAGSENWAGVYSKRREILQNPAYGKASEVKRIMSELDMGLKNWGSEITTDGREVSFQDVARMASSSDPAEQKQAFRILALRSENSEGFIDTLPMDQVNTRDPLFRAQLKSFIRDNPRVDRDDYVRYKQAETEYLGSLKQQFAHDPVLAAQMIASPEVKEALDKMRAGMLTGKTGNEADWLPRLTPNDVALKDTDLMDLGEALKVQIGRQGDTMAMEVVKGIGEFFSGSEGDALDKVRNNPKLAALSAEGFLPAAYDDKSLGDYLGGIAGPAATAAFYGFRGRGIGPFKAVNQVLQSYGRKTLVARVGASAAFEAGAGTAVRAAVGGAARLLGPAAVIMGVTEGVRAITHQRAIDKHRAEADAALRTIISNKSMLLSKVQAGGGADSDTFSTLDQLARALEKFNLVAQRAGAEYRLDLPHLFGQAQWKAIHARMMLNSRTRQQITQSGMDQRLNFSPFGSASPLPAQQPAATLPAPGAFPGSAAPSKPAP